MVRLFVGGCREASKADIFALFKQFGATEDGITFPRDRRTRRKKGYAYVNVTDDRAAEAAIVTFHLADIAGVKLTVVRAEERPPKKPRLR
jgi:RNA recognition motif-containing protein